MNTKFWCMVFLILLSGLIDTFSPAWAEENEPKVTRWMSSEEATKPLHEALSIFQPSVLNRVAPERLLSPIPPAAPSGRICIVVHEDVYADITDALGQYIADLEFAGFAIVTYIYTSGTSESVRVQLAALYQEESSLVGAVFIGNIPYIIYELMQDWGSGAEYEDFPCDLFYMDLDGTWSDTLSEGSVQPGNEKYDTRGGDLSLEIWVSRLRADNLGSLGTESDLLKTYFNKNHRYRKGRMVPSPNALIYNDDDWQSLINSDAIHLEMMYESLNITKISEPEETIAADYKTNHLTGLYKFILVRSHGSCYSHGFYRNSKSTFEYVYPSDYTSRDPEAVFYSLFICSGADYTRSNNLAGIITFNPDDSGLLSIGSTKTGGMWQDNAFYTALGNSAVFGEAFRLWFNDVQSRLPSSTPRWWYGMVLIGDGALTKSNPNSSSLIPMFQLLLGQ